MFGKLLAAFILIPLIEFFLLVEVAARTSIGTTFLLVVCTGFLGSFLARREGLEVWRKFHLTMHEGRVPSNEIQDGLMIIIAGALLLTPGLLTDAFGFFLLLPLGRSLVRVWLVNRYIAKFHVHVSDLHGFQTYTANGQTRHQNHSDNPNDTIDVEVVRKVEK